VSRRKPHWYIGESPRRREAVLTLPQPAAPTQQLEPDGDDFLGTVRGNFLRMNNWNEIWSPSEAGQMDLRGNRFIEIVRDGALDKTLIERQGRIRALWNHGSEGKRPIGQLTNISQDGFFTLRLFDTQSNRELLPALRHAQVGVSYASDHISGDILKRAKRSEYNPKGLPEVQIREIGLKEVSIVTFPADAGTHARLVE
jgi:HK97 family phage prohead protease